MNGICFSEFWVPSLTWYTTVPLFTPCFLKVGLIWIPVAFFWLFAPAEIYYMSRKQKKKIPWSLLNITKLMFILLMMGLTVADITYRMIQFPTTKILPVDYYTPFLLFITLVVNAFMLLYQRKKGRLYSVVLSLFWFFVCMGTSVGYYTSVQKIFNEVIGYDREFEKFQYSMYVLYFGFSLTLFLFHGFADLKEDPNDVSPKESPEERASFWSRLTFFWFTPMTILGYKKPLTQDDMWDLSEENTSSFLQSQFDKYWLPVVNKAKNYQTKVRAALSRRYLEMQNFDCTKVIITPDIVDEKPPKISILKPILKKFGWEMFFCGILKLFASLITFVNPLILDELITFIGSNDPYWKGFIFAIGMFLAAMLESFLNGQYDYKIFGIRMRIRCCIISTVYKKALTLSNSARKNFTVGEIVNIMAIDTLRVVDYVQMVNIIWSAPLQIAVATYLLWQQLGIATLGGLIVLLLMIPIHFIISIYIRKFRVILMKEKDARIKLMNEILNGIKVLKLYAWENSFIKKILNIRGKEIGSLRVHAYLNSVSIFFFNCAPFLVSLTSFATYVLVDSSNILDANKAFVSLSLFNILQLPTAYLPMMMTMTAIFLVSLKRINLYLQGDELDMSIIEHDQFEKDPVVIEDGTFSWTVEDPPVLTNLNIRVKEGALVAVVGQVGCGKSSLLSALLGDMVKWCGRVNVKGTVTYVPQQAWIQNATLRKNVLFTKEYDEKWYNTVLEACALCPDLEILPGGDLTEIGEKGINLSGGQKQRVSLARALYNNADIYYFDDPLSAVDAHVGKHIFEKVIGPSGVLKEKTRILVTHRISVLPEVDTIIVLQDGKITDTGSYSELLAKKGAFADFLIQYLQTNTEEVTNEILPDELNLMQEIAATIEAPPEITRQLSKIGDKNSSELASPVKSEPSPSKAGAGEIFWKQTKSYENSSSKKHESRHKFDTKEQIVQSKLTEKEGMETGSVKSSVYLNYMRSYGYWNTFFTILCCTLSTAFSLSGSLWLSAWSNDASDSSKINDVKLRNLRLEVYAGLGAGEIVFTLGTVLLLNLACLWASKALHEGMLYHIMHAPMSFFETTPLGRILNRFSKDIDATDIVIRWNLRLFLISFFKLISAIIIISIEMPLFLVAAIPLSIIYYFLQKFYVPTSRQLKRLESITCSPVYSHFSETLTGATSIRAYKAEDEFMRLSNNLVDINNQCYYPSIGATRWLSIYLEFLGYSIVFFVALFSILARDTISPGIAGLAVSYALQMTIQLNNLVKHTADVETNIVAVERCLEYTKTPVEAEWNNEENKPEPYWPAAGRIKFEDYSTRYREGLELVLKGVSCNITPTERCGIVGRTGAGKSSLALALFRILEADGGTILIDGVDIAKLGLHDLRSKLTIIPQDPVLFTGTLRSNLDPFGACNDEALWLALEQSHLKDFVLSLEKGLDHKISEGGENISVGQRQLVCLARALLRKTRILVLDEATAAVDVETDDLIQATIHMKFKQCTVLTIAHRLNTIMDYDKVIVLSKGEIVEMDSPENLLKNENSVFYSMAKDAGLV